MNLTEEHVFQIANARSRRSALSVIKANINQSFKFASDIWRNEILLDCVLDTVNYSLRHGFSLRESALAGSIMHDLIAQIRNDTSLSWLLERLIAHLRTAPTQPTKPATTPPTTPLSAHKANLLIDYADATLLTHFSLFKYVFTVERESHVISDDRPLFAPPSLHARSHQHHSAAHPLPHPHQQHYQQQDHRSGNARGEQQTAAAVAAVGGEEELQEHQLRGAKTYARWEHEQQVRALDELERKLNEESARESQRQLAEQEEANKRLLSFVLNDAHGRTNPLDDQSLRQLADDISAPLLELASKSLKQHAAEVSRRTALDKRRNQLQLEGNAMAAATETGHHGNTTHTDQVARKAGKAAASAVSKKK